MASRNSTINRTRLRRTHGVQTCDVICKSNVLLLSQPAPLQYIAVGECGGEFLQEVLREDLRTRSRTTKGRIFPEVVKAEAGRPPHSAQIKVTWVGGCGRSKKVLRGDWKTSDGTSKSI